MKQSKAFIHAKAQRNKHFQTSFVTTTKGTFLGRKVKAIVRNKKIMNEKAHLLRQR